MLPMPAKRWGEREPKAQARYSEAPQTHSEEIAMPDHTPLTAERIDELEAMYGAATPGPWEVYADDGWAPGRHVVSGRTIFGGYGEVDIFPTENDGCGSDPQSDYVNVTKPDAQFIVAAHNAFPALLAAARENAALRDRVSLIEAEALRRAAGVADQVHAEQKTANLSYVDGWLDAADIIFQRIEALIPAKGADRDAD